MNCKRKLIGSVFLSESYSQTLNSMKLESVASECSEERMRSVCGGMPNPVVKARESKDG